MYLLKLLWGLLLNSQLMTFTKNVTELINIVAALVENKS